MRAQLFDVSLHLLPDIGKMITLDRFVSVKARTRRLNFVDDC